MMRMAKAVSSVAEAIHNDLPQNQLSPQYEHCMDAIAQLQSLDNNIEVDDMVTMTMVFQEDIKALDTYIILSKLGMQPEICHAWVQKMLAKAHPLPPNETAQYSGMARGQNDFLDGAEGTANTSDGSFGEFHHHNLFSPGTSYP
jgi:hypothetical protein